MSTSVSIEPLPLSDPRGARKKPVDLATRLGRLRGKHVLLFDNAQLTGHLHTYGPLLTWLRGHFEGEGATCSTASRNLFDVSRDEMIQLAETIAKSESDGVVIALCKGGMTQPTSLFAVELERRGMPCVLIVTEHAIALASDTAASFVPGLPIVVTQPGTGDAENLGKVQADAIAPAVIAGLTHDAATLLKEFRARFGAAETGSEDDTIALPEREFSASDRQGKTVVKLDAAALASDVYEQFCAADMCDGLPIIPPTQSRVDAMLAATDRDPELLLVEDCPPSGSSISIRSLAVNAVMAGCKPEYFPIVVTAFEAIAAPEYRLFQGAITTHPSGNAVVVSGPLAQEIGIHSGGGCLGPGFRANATIGRAVSMTIVNVTRAIPDKSDMSCFGSPAEFTYCFAESDTANPWQPLHTDLYGADVTSVTVHKCEAPHNVVDPRSGPEALLRAVASTAATLGGNNLTHLGQMLILLNPEHAKAIAAAGWSKRDVKEFLFEIARHPVEASSRRERPVFPKYFHKLAMVPVTRSPDDIIVLVCGRQGPHSMVAIPWGLSRAVTRPVARKDGAPIQTSRASR